DVAPDADGVVPFGLAVAEAWLGHRAGDGEIAAAVRHLRYLRTQGAGREKGRMQRPARAGVAIARNMQARGAEALRDIAGKIAANEMERDTAFPGLHQSREAMADLLEAGIELLLQQLYIISVILCRTVELIIGEQHGAREIAGERGARLRLCGLRRQLRRISDIHEEVRVGQLAAKDREMKIDARLRQ